MHKYKYLNSIVFTRVSSTTSDSAYIKDSVCGIGCIIGVEIENGELPIVQYQASVCTLLVFILQSATNRATKAARQHIGCCLQAATDLR